MYIVLSLHQRSCWPCWTVNLEYSPNLPKFVPFERIMEKLWISRSQA